MIINNSYAYAEVLELLEYMDKIYVDKIPTKLLELFKNNSSPKYKKHINPMIKLNKQPLNKDTFTILAIINLKYWINNEEQKQQILNCYRKNEKTSNNIPSMQFYSQDIFINKNEKPIADTSLPTVIENDSFFNKIINLIKKLFSK